MSREITEDKTIHRSERRGDAGDRRHGRDVGSLREGTEEEPSAAVVLTGQGQNTAAAEAGHAVSGGTISTPGGEHTVAETNIFEHRGFTRSPNRRTTWIVAAVGLVAVAALFLLWSRRDSTADSTKVAANAEAVEHAAGEASGGGKHGAEEGAEVRLEPEALASAGFEYEGVTQRPAVALLRVTGTVEANPRQTQQVSPLVGGRVESVNVAIGDRVDTGTVLATVSSPDIAEMHGKLREAETRLFTAERNLQRVQRTENRVNVLSAKARLDETEATLKRTRRLIELGAGAGKDLIAAEAAYKTAKAEYDFQSNIPLNRELQEAQAEVRTAQTEVSHLKASLGALGAPIPDEGRDDHSRNISLVPLRAPAAGLVTERAVNPGAGVSVGQSLFTISNLSTVYIIASVPEAQVGNVREGTPAEIRSAALGERAIRGRVSYIDPRLDEATRTARARIEVANPGERLRAGMFVEVGFQTTTGAATGEELVVPSSAIQRIGDKTIVFIPKENERGSFEVREIEVGGEQEGYARVLSGLKLGERVVTKGSFTLKTQKQKGELGEE